MALSAANRPDFPHTCALFFRKFSIAAFVTVGFLVAFDVSAEIPNVIRTGDSVFSVAWSKDGKTIASGGSEGQILLWDGVTHKKLRKITGHQSIVLSLAFSPDNTLLASGGEDEAIRIWRMPDASPVHTLETPIQESDIENFSSNDAYSVTFSPNGQFLAAGTHDGFVRIWNVSDWKLIRTLPKHADSVYSIAFSKDGSLIASGSADGTIRISSVATGGLVRLLQAHSNWVSAIAFSPQGTLASGCWGCGIKIWNVSSGAAIRALPANDGVSQVAFSPDGLWLASAIISGEISLFRTTDGRLTSLKGHGSNVKGIAFGPNGTLASVSDDETIRFWSLPGQ